MVFISIGRVCPVVQIAIKKRGPLFPGSTACARQLHSRTRAVVERFSRRLETMATTEDLDWGEWGNGRQRVPGNWRLEI